MNHFAGYPDQCGTFIEREEQHLRAHNRYILAARQVETAARRTHQRRESEAQRQVILQLLSATRMSRRCT